ncbi:energy transducer TonB [Rheinheimera sp. WS51]|uniref:tetratricopeptide repeat protein n=1 Tax=Rheinheimera sp. WS51 TaxID=3425886 RepID=UPI003D8D4460
MMKLRYSLAFLWLTYSLPGLADFPTAKALFDQAEYALAKPQMETLAELGHVEAQYLLSRMYAEGLGVDPDLKLAYAWTLIAKDRDHPEADKAYRKLRTQLESRLEGKNVYNELNDKYGEQALFDNLYPVPNRFVPAEHRLRSITKPEPDYPSYFNRIGVNAWAVVHYDIAEDGKVENIKVAAAFPIDSINQYVIDAMKQWRFESPKDIFGDPIRLEMQSQVFKLENSSGAKARKYQRESNEYIDAILAAANAESARYQYLYGILAENNIVTDPEPLSWYIKAAVNGSKSAQYRLAQCLISGNGCKLDRNKAINWLHISADGGDERSAYLLAQELLDRNNANFNPRKAASYLEIAALKEYMPAITDYAELLAMSSDPVIRDPQKAIRLAEQGRAIDSNNPKLLAAIGVAFIELGQKGRGLSMLKQALAEAKQRNWAYDSFETLLLDYSE